MIYNNEDVIMTVCLGAWSTIRIPDVAVYSDDDIDISVVNIASSDDDGDDDDDNEKGFSQCQCILIAKHVVIVDINPERPCLLWKNVRLRGNDFFFRGDDFTRSVFDCCCCGCCLVEEEDTLHAGLHMLPTAPYDDFSFSPNDRNGMVDWGDDVRLHLIRRAPS
jgi:hypothetical protein